MKLPNILEAIFGDRGRPKIPRWLPGKVDATVTGETTASGGNWSMRWDNVRRVLVESIQADSALLDPDGGKDNVIAQAIATGTQEFRDRGHPTYGHTEVTVAGPGLSGRASATSGTKAPTPGKGRR